MHSGRVPVVMYILFNNGEFQPVRLAFRQEEGAAAADRGLRFTRGFPTEICSICSDGAFESVQLRTSLQEQRAAPPNGDARQQQQPDRVYVAGYPIAIYFLFSSSTFEAVRPTLWHEDGAAAANRDLRFTREFPTEIRNIYSDGTFDSLQFRPSWQEQRAAPPNRDMRQYHQPLGENARPEQCDRDGMEMQHAGREESHHPSDESDSDSGLCRQG
jgi:hypothetical protein